jgi:hypothetical protein
MGWSVVALRVHAMYVVMLGSSRLTRRASSIM